MIVPDGVDVEVDADVDGPGGNDLFGAEGERHRLEPCLGTATADRRRPA